MATQIRNEDMSSVLSVDGFKYGLWTEVVAGFQALPGLVGFWPMSSIQKSTGNVYDLSGQGRTLTYSAGVGSYSGYNNLVPVFNFAGGGHLYRASETDLNISGTEAIILNKGLTMGGWFNLTSVSTTQTLIGKRGGTPGSGYAYHLQYDATYDGFIHYSSPDGSTLYSVGPGAGSMSTAGTWNFVVGRYAPSTELSIFWNGTWYAGGLYPASIANNTGNFSIGAFTGANEPMNGLVSLCFLSAMRLADSHISGIWQRSRLLFGV